MAACQSLILFAIVWHAQGVKLPSFSWDTVPVFWHAADPSGTALASLYPVWIVTPLVGPLSSEALGFLRTHQFPLVSIEKFQAASQAPVNDNAEVEHRGCTRD
jgi:hypothetical protein